MSVRLWPCAVVDVRVGAAPPPEPNDAVKQRWRELTADNPRHFAGTILSVDDFDHETGVVLAHVDEYTRLAAQPQVDSGVVLLAATAVVTAQDRAGRAHVLMIQRAAQTRIYPGQWELGPSGGVEPTGADLGLEDIVALLQQELLEEAGLEDPLEDPRVCCAYLDEEAMSFDVVVRASLSTPIESLEAKETHWDAADAAWAPIDELGSFLASRECIPPTRLVLGAAGLL